MNQILVLKTSTNATMKRLLQDLKKEKIDCLIQSSQIDRYRVEYPKVYFIDIRQEGFYDLPADVIGEVSEKIYDELYVTFSGINGHNYGNVMELVSKVHFRKAFFYNCNGDKTEIPKPNLIKDMLCGAYIKFVSFIYGVRREQ